MNKQVLSIVAGILVLTPLAQGQIWKFDCGTKDSPVWPECVQITKESVYNPTNGYGWVGNSGIQDYNLTSYGTPLNFPEGVLQDLVSGSGVFRLDVPAGKYKVHLVLSDGLLTSYSPNSTPYSVEVGGEKVVDVKHDSKSYLEKYYSLALVDYHAGDDLYEKYITPRFPEKMVETEVINGKCLEVKLNQAFLCALVVYPAAEAQAGDKWVKAWQAARKEAFGKIARRKEVEPEKDAVLPTAKDTQAGFQVFTRHYMEYIYPNSKPRPEEMKEELRMMVTPGEYEPVVIGINPLKAMEGVKVEVTELKSKEGGVIPAPALEVRYAKYMENTGAYGARFANPYTVEPKMLMKPDAMTLNFEPGVTRAFWITLHAPEEAKAGIYEGKVKVSAKNGAARELKLKVKVLPFRLEEPKNVAFGMWYYMPTFLRSLPGGDQAFWDAVERSLIDFKKHGCESLDARQLIKFNRENDKIVGFDFTEMSRFMDLMKKHGMKGPVFLSDGACGTSGIRNPPPFGIKAEFMSDAFKQELKFCITALRDRARAEQWPGYPDVWFWVTDELSNKGKKNIEEATGLLKVWREVEGAKLVSACNGVGEFVLLPYLDMMIVNNGIHIDEAKLKMMHDKAVKPGFSNISGWESTRFTHAYYLWKTGAGYLSQWHYDDYRGDPFNPFDGNCGDVYVYAFPLPDEMAPTAIWEVTREGIDDYKYLITLEKYIADGKKCAAAKDAVAEAEQLRDDLKDRVVERLDYYVQENGFWPPTVYDKLRSRLASCITDIMNAMETK